MSLPRKTILSTQQTILSSIESNKNAQPAASSSLISPMMESLNSQALGKARSAIARKFKDPIDLDELNLYTSTLQKNMSIADTQLSGAVQGKMDALKRAVDLMDESAVKLSSARGRIAKTEERITQANTVISNFEYLRRVHHVRDNLQKVIAQVEFFSRVPERVTYLREVLDSDPSRLKEVFLESLKLENLRFGLVDEIQLSKDRRSSVLGTGGQGGKRTQRGGDSDSALKVKEAVDDHLHIVSELLSDVHKKLFGNIRDLWELSLEGPADLVTTFEVIEMYQEYVDRRAAQQKKIQSQVRGSNSTSGESSGLEVQAHALEALKSVLVGKIEESFTLAGVAAPMKSKSSKKGKKVEDESDEEYANHSPTERLLNAGTQVISMMQIFQEEVVICLPPYYDSMATFVDIFEDELVPMIENLVEQPSELEVVDLLQLIDWMEYYREQMCAFGFDELKCLARFTVIAEDLLSEYLDRIKNQVMSWFNNINKQPMDIVKAADLTLITSHPEDMFNVIHVQMEVAKEKLPSHRLKDVVNACLQVLREVQRESYDNLSLNWQSLDPETLCSMINDNQRMQEKCEEFATRVVGLVPQEDHRDLLSAMLEDVSSEYVLLAVNGIGYLARSVLEDLEEPVFSNLFSAEWETTFGETLSSVMIATLQDYIVDIHTWLPDYFYSKFIREILNRLTGCYVMSLRRQSASAFRFNSEIMAARKMIGDLETFQTFFDTYAEELRRGGLKPKTKNPGTSAVSEELEPIANLARIVSATHIANVNNDATALFVRYGADGLKLVHAALSCNPSLNRNSRLESIEAANKLFELGGPKGKYPTALSDLYRGVTDLAVENHGKQKTLTKTKSKAKSRFFG